jgi:succinate dehydrogenase / fumarate reductase iron-sulfur subunit
MLIKVYRFDPSLKENSHYDSFKVPVIADEQWTVMEILRYIQEHFDSSLSFYSHSVCNHGICGRCTLMVNGSPVLACTHTVSNETELILEPLKNKQIIKDLVTL